MVTINVTLDELKMILAKRASAFAGIANSEADPAALKEAFQAVMDLQEVVAKLS